MAPHQDYLNILSADSKLDSIDITAMTMHNIVTLGDIGNGWPGQ